MSMLMKGLRSSRASTFVASLASLAVLVLGGGAAQANPRYAAFVMHADSGDVLFSRYADAPRYPASLTKVMTLYLLFEALEAGDLSLSDKLTVSRRAAGQAPSKLGLTPGEKISVETAIDALVVRSANDVATVVAEALAGTEYKFSLKMTSKARALGMRHTRFRNASGLPDRRQKTTARDLAILAQRMLQDFPQYYSYFELRSFQYKGRAYRTHNRLVLNYAGANGLKTGYTRWSGYNLATTVERDGHRLIGVVLGGRTSRSRDQHMQQILDAAYAQVKRNPRTLRTAFRRSPTPVLKPSRVAALEASPAISELAGPGLIAAAAPQTTDQDEIGLLIADLDLDSGGVEPAMGQGDAVDDDLEPPAPARISGGGWAVQIGAYYSRNKAKARLEQLASEIGAPLALADQNVSPRKRHRRVIYRARFMGFEEAQARAACAALTADGLDCLVVKDPA